MCVEKRAAMLELSVDRASAANALAATVLKSIDAMISKYECLPKVFCEGNRQGKVIGYGFQYSMPLFRLVHSLFFRSNWVCLLLTFDISVLASARPLLGKS